MHVILAGVGAIVVGAGDFAGGAATRRDRPLPVTVVAFAVGTIALLAVVPLFDGEPTLPDMVWGTVSGLGGALGVATLYRGFQRAAMGLVAPVAAVITAAIPVAGGVVRGERPGPLVIGGLFVGLAAIMLISMGPSSGAAAAPGTRLAAVGHGAVTGIGFGLMLLAISLIGDEAGLLPLVGGRAASLGVGLALALVVGGTPLPSSARARLIAAVSGVLTVAGNTLYYLALTVGPVVTSTVIYSLFPASTVVLARIVYRERLRPTQSLGVALALVATALLVAG